MPVRLPAISRRGFVVGVGAVALHGRAAEAKRDPGHIALLSDIHVHADKDLVAKTDVHLYGQLEKAVRQIAALDDKPASVIVTGDLSFHGGDQEDYPTVLEGLAPLREAGMDVHLMLGNHDHRGNFFAALGKDFGKRKEIADRQAAVLATPAANLFVLDSLWKTIEQPGEVGEKQRAWLGRALDARKDKPAIVFVHHNLEGQTEKKGLIDTEAFLKVLVARRQVKALVHGHTHEWAKRDKEGLTVINLPTTAYVYKQGVARGWVDLWIGNQSATVEFRSTDEGSEKDREKFEITLT